MSGVESNRCRTKLRRHGAHFNPSPVSWTNWVDSCTSQIRCICKVRDHKVLTGENSSPCIFMHRHKRRTPARRLQARRSHPRGPGTRLCAILQVDFGE